MIQSVGRSIFTESWTSFLPSGFAVVYIQFVRTERATGANLAKQMDWELSAGLSPDYLP